MFGYQACHVGAQLEHIFLFIELSEAYKLLLFGHLSFNRNNMQTAVTNMTKQRMFQKLWLINDLTFRMPQHTSSEVTVGYLTIRLRARVFYEQIVNEAQPS